MTITPQDLLDHAEELIQQQEELNFRAGAGRAFYAAFHACGSILARIDTGPETKEGTHSRNIRLLTGFYGGPKEEIAAKVRRLGFMYRQARDIRSHADYNIQEDFTEKKARIVLDTAQRMLEICSELEGEQLG